MRQGLKATAGGVVAAVWVQVLATTAWAQTDAAFPYALSPRKLEEAASPMRWVRLAAEMPRRSEGAERRDAKAAPPASPVSPPARQKTTQRNAPAAAASPVPPKRPVEPTLTPIAEVAPQWDAETLAELRRGRVKVRFAVQKDGSLEEVEVIESTDRRLTGPAMAAILQWQFVPMNEPANATVEFGFGDSATPPR